MYTPPAFRDDDRASIEAAINASRLSTIITATADGLVATHLPLVFHPDEGAHGVLYGHVAKANPQWRMAPVGEALAIITGPEAYVSPSWYVTKQETGKSVPTWNYVAIHAYGPVEFYDDPARLLTHVTELTNHHEGARAEPWAVTNAPADYIASQLRGIVGIRLPITRLEGKKKVSQNRNSADRAGVIAGLYEGDRQSDHVIAALIPR